MRRPAATSVMAAGLVMALLAGCGADDDTEAQPDPSVSTTAASTGGPAGSPPVEAGPPPSGLTIRVEYPRYLQHKRRLAVVIDNVGAEPVQITRVQLLADHFELEPPEDKAHAVVTPGSRLDLQADFGELTSCDPEATLGAAVALDIVLSGDVEPTPFVVALDPTPLDDIRERECGRRDIDAALEVAFGDSDLVIEDLDVVTTLELTRRDGVDPVPVTVQSIRGSVLIDLDAEAGAGADPAADVVGTLAADQGSLSIPIRFHVFRCEPHAVAASTKTYEFQTWIALGDDPGDFYVVPLPDALRAALEARLQACIATQSEG